MDFIKPQESQRNEAKIISINSNKNQFLTNKILSYKRPAFDSNFIVTKK